MTQGAPSVPLTVSPIYSNVDKPKGEIEQHEESRLNDFENKKEAKGIEEGRVGRKGEDLDMEEEIEKEEAAAKSGKEKEERGAEDTTEDTTTTPRIKENFEVRRPRIGRRPMLPTKR